MTKKESFFFIYLYITPGELVKHYVDLDREMNDI